MPVAPAGAGSSDPATHAATAARSRVSPTALPLPAASASSAGSGLSSASAVRDASAVREASADSAFVENTAVA